ncbi:Fungalysin/Thermolysin Extracellular metalloproteinase 5 [Irineochytrium annulatum]|nr:Fungalysin/Thermolysin Extracellular metalloproteinase 5 [Irineochytrium annulatum]
MVRIVSAAAAACLLVSFPFIAAHGDHGSAAGRSHAGISFGPDVPAVVEPSRIHVMRSRKKDLSARAVSAVPVSTEEAVQVALEYATTKLNQNMKPSKAVQTLTVTDFYTSEHSGVTHVYLVQVIDGVEVQNGVSNVNVASDGVILSFASSFYGQIDEDDDYEEADNFAPELELQQSGRQQVLGRRGHDHDDDHHRGKSHRKDRHNDNGDHADEDDEGEKDDVERPRWRGWKGKEDRKKEKKVTASSRKHDSAAPRKSKAVHAINKKTFLLSNPTTGDISTPVEALLSLTEKLGFVLTAADVSFSSFDSILPTSRSDPDYVLTVPASLVRPRSASLTARSFLKDEKLTFPAKLKYIQTASRELRPVWDLVMDLGDNWFNAQVDAVKDRKGKPGDIIQLVDWVSDASYTVFPIGINDPESGDRVRVKDPANKLASPYGWHKQSNVTSGRPLEFTTTVGNNVFAHENLDGRGDWINKKRPDGSSSLDFDFPIDFSLEPVDYIDAAVTNLFYWNNAIHDLFYVYGFTEQSGNFQMDNLEKGGKGDDAVIANAQDGSGYNNANFATPPDGGHGRMRMYVWDVTDPMRDGDLEGGIIMHEYAHGISIRLTGGPANSGCLGWGEAGGMGEGWGDYFATILRTTVNSTREDVYSMGSYANGGHGIRKYKYSTSKSINPSTYSYVAKPGYWGVHAKGEVWAVILYEVYWNLVDALGFNPDWFDTPLADVLEEGAPGVPAKDENVYLDFATGQRRPRPASFKGRGKGKGKKGEWTRGGNILALQIVIDGLKLQKCTPTFVDARDAILLAEEQLTGGKYACEIWTAFAKRGMGVKAEAGGRDSSAVPKECKGREGDNDNEAT